MVMTDKLKEFFNLPDDSVTQEIKAQVQESRAVLTEIDSVLGRIDVALPTVKDLNDSDQELDELADMAKTRFQDLMDLGFNVDSRFAGEIFGVASNMLGHAISARTAKLNKKLRVVELQLKKARLDQQNKNEPTDLPLGQGQVLSRNELLEKLLTDRQQNTKKE